MATEQVIVRVVQGAAVVDEAIRRPVRLTPDGYAGVVYGGAVYPLFADNGIDIDGASWEPEDSNRFLMSGTSVPYAPRPGGADAPAFAGFGGEWYVESNRFGHYVVFNASERVAGDLVVALEAGGLAIQRWDVSYRAAADGRHYDWFARLRYQGSRDEIVALVREVFAGPDVPLKIPVIPAEERLAELQTRVESLAGQVVDLQVRLAEEVATAASLRSRLLATTERSDRLDPMLTRALEHQRALSLRLEALPQQSAGAPIEDLLNERAEREELLEFALAENAELELRVRELTETTHLDAKQIETLNESLIDYAGRLEEFGEEQRVRSTRRREVPPRGVIAWVASSFPRLDFGLDSLETLETFEASRGLNRALVSIDGGETVGKDLEGFAGWREISKLPTGIAGSEDMGRIYYRPNGARVLVIIHVKQDNKEQGRFLRRLSSL